jgi:hypothetical protein
MNKPLPNGKGNSIIAWIVTKSLTLATNTLKL